MTQKPDAPRETALVVGGARGIGRAISDHLSSAGYLVYATSRQADRSAGTEDDRAFDGIRAVAMDINEPESIASVHRHLRESGEAPRILVANAGVTRDQLFPTCDFEDWTEVVMTNLVGTARVVRTFVPDMVKARRGRVIIVSSISGIRGGPGQTAYSASKAGLIGFARTLAREVGRFGVNVNCISPGIIEGGMTDMVPERMLQERVAMSALRRIGSPTEVAAAVLALCGEAGAFVTGQNLIVDGGIVMQ